MAVVITEEARRAAIVAFYGRIPVDPSLDRRMDDALTAALPHLTDTGLPLAEPEPKLAAQYRATLEAQQAAAEQALAVQKAAMAGITADRLDDELNTERKAADRELWLAALRAQVERQPTDYEIWRDALTLAVTEGGHIDSLGSGIGRVSGSALLARATWFYTELQLGPMTERSGGAKN